MDKFKEMTARFAVCEDTAFKAGTWHKDRSDFMFEVKRFRSGCTAYGDHSGHTVEIVNHPETYKHHFDTRYVGISKNKDEWISYWKNWIENEYNLKLKQMGYSEELVDDTD